MFPRGQNGRIWRAIVACAGAYALALNVILASVLGGPLAVAGGNPAGFEICLDHKGTPDQQSPASPDAGKFHCVLCIASFDASVLSADAVATVALGNSEIISADSADNAGPSPTHRDPGKPPTGPPLTA